MRPDPNRDLLMRELAHSTHPRAAPLLHRMNRCEGENEWGGQFTCRTHGCKACRDREIGKQVRKARDRFASARNEDLAFLSVVIGATCNVEEVREVFRKFNKDLRNLTDANRRQRRRWRRLEVLLWLETDAMAGDDFVHLAPDKTAQLGEMIPLFVHESGPVWIVTAHGIVHHPGVEIQEVRAEFERRWPGHKRAHLQAFWLDQPKDKNIRRTINYAMKHECRTHLGAVEERWPGAWMAQYYSDLSEWSRGFLSTRFSINAAKDKSSRTPDESYSGQRECALEPVPFTYTSSTLDTYYNWFRS